MLQNVQHSIRFICFVDLINEMNFINNFRLNYREKKDRYIDYM